jgi:DNA-binding NtrC family response regulator
MAEVILVVDDSADDCMLVEKLLVHAGYTVVQATNVGKAQELLAERPEVAVIVCDLNMPDGGAVALLENRPAQPVIVMSGAFPEEGAGSQEWLQDNHAYMTISKGRLSLLSGAVEAAMSQK